MKLLPFLLILATTVLLIVRYRIERDIKFLLSSLAIFAFLIACAALTPMLRPILPLFYAHGVALFIGWGGLLYFLLRKRFVIWLTAAPLATLGLFLILSIVEGSRYEEVWFG